MLAHTILTDRQTDRQFDYRNNCLNTIRLIAAISVMYIHAIAHLEVDMPALVTRIISFFQGVPIFFAMSGFLVWDSIGRSNNFVSYAKKRFLRIYPELWCAVLLSLIAILTLYDAKISWGALGLFTVTQGTVLQFWTPDFLRGYGCGTPNGSLWTVGITIQFYLVLYFLYKLLRNKSLKIWLTILVGAILIEVASPLIQRILPGIVYKLFRQTVIPRAWMFLVGTMIAAKRDILMPVLRKYWMLFLTISAVAMYSGMDIVLGDYKLFACLTLIPGVIGFAYSFPKVNIKIDISYGVYIYHMIVVNIMIVLGLTGNPIYLLTAMLITCFIAFVSERTVGRWSMRLKTKG